MAPDWLAGRRGSDHHHPNDDNGPYNDRRKDNATEHRAPDRAYMLSPGRVGSAAAAVGGG